jgi:hypothetical protein
VGVEDEGCLLKSKLDLLRGLCTLEPRMGWFFEPFPHYRERDQGQASKITGLSPSCNLNQHSTLLALIGGCGIFLGVDGER